MPNPICLLNQLRKRHDEIWSLKVFKSAITAGEVTTKYVFAYHAII